MQPADKHDPQQDAAIDEAQEAQPPKQKEWFTVCVKCGAEPKAPEELVQSNRIAVLQCTDISASRDVELSFALVELRRFPVCKKCISTERSSGIFTLFLAIVVLAVAALIVDMAWIRLGIALLGLGLVLFLLLTVNPFAPDAEIAERLALAELGSDANKEKLRGAYGVNTFVCAYKPWMEIRDERQSARRLNYLKDAFFNWDKKV